MLGWVLLAWFIVGGVIVVRGLRGRTVDDHPVCAACSFDLVGLVTRVGPATTCPECGADVAPDRGVAWGRHARQPWLIAFGGVLVLTAAAVVAGPAVLRANRGTLIRNAPYWFVKKHALDTRNGVSMEYQLELLRRMNDDLLDSEQIADIAINALSLQPRVDVPLGHWADLFYKADQAGVVTVPQRQAFLEGSLQLALAARPTVAVGDVMPFQLQGWWRGASFLGGFHPRAESVQGVEFTFESLAIGTHSLPVPSRPRSSSWGAGEGAEINWGWGWTLETPPVTFSRAEIAPGQYEMSATIRVDWNRLGTWPPGPAAMSASGLRPWWTRVLRAPIQIVPAGSGTIETVTDAALAARYKAMIQPTPYLDGTEFGFSYGPGASGGFPEDAAFRVMTPAGSRRETIGSLLCRKNGRYYSTSFNSELVRRIMKRRPGEMRIILVPDPDLAKQTTDMTRVYAGPEIIMTMPLR